MVEDFFNQDLPYEEIATSALPAPAGSTAVDPSALSFVPTGPPIGMSWAPSFMEIRVERVGSQQHFNQFANWRGGTSPLLRPQIVDCTAGACITVRWGMEFQVDTYNYSHSSNVRPFCTAGHNEVNFLAINETFYNWGASAGPTGLSASTGAYKDNWELQDACHKNSFGVGMRYPENIPVNANGYRQVLLSIGAPAGTMSSAHISGSVTLNDDRRCYKNPDWPLEHCMGYDLITPPVPWEPDRTTLSTGRNWYATPNKCWFSASWGLVPPTYVMPHDSDGCF